MGGRLNAAVHAVNGAGGEQRAAVAEAASLSTATTDGESLFSMSRFQEHQAACKRLSHAEEARTLVKLGRYAVLSTLSRAMDGHPSGSVVAYGSGSSAELVFAFSRLSSHTSDVTEDPRAAVTITGAPGAFGGAADARVTLHGSVQKIEAQEEIAEAREAFLQCHPDAFWVDFGDFSWFRMSEIKMARLVGGFARAGTVSAKAFLDAEPCPVSEFAGPVLSHMNSDHEDATIAMIKGAVGLDVDSATLTGLDKYGMDVKTSRRIDASASTGDDNASTGDDTEVFKLRLPFPSEAKTRGDLKTLIVQMTKQAQASRSA